MFDVIVTILLVTVIVVAVVCMFVDQANNHQAEAFCIAQGYDYGYMQGLIGAAVCSTTTVEYGYFDKDAVFDVQSWP